MNMNMNIHMNDTWNASEAEAAAEAAESQAITVEILNQVRTVVQCVMTPVINFFGVCANSLNMVVLSQRGMRSSTSVYLIALAAYDILYLLASAFNNTGYCTPGLQFGVLRDFGIPMSNLFSNTAVFIICTFTFERYIAVSYPIRGRIWCTVWRATVTTLCICVIAALLTVPDFLPETVQQRLESAIGYGWINTTIFTNLPIVFLVFCNALLIKVVYQASRLRKHMQQPPRKRNGVGAARSFRIAGNNGTQAALDSQAQAQARRSTNEQNKLTVMLIVVVIVFVVCQLPQAILYLSRRYYDAQNIKLSEQTRDIRRIIGNFSNMLVQINAASNFVLYSMFSTRFRATFRRTFCLCATRDNDTTTTVAESNGTVLQRSSPSSFTPLQRNVTPASAPTPCACVELKPVSPSRNEVSHSRR